MPLLEDFASSEIGLFTGVTILFLASVFTIRSSDEIDYIIPVFIILCLGITILFWWKKKTDEAYKKCITDREKSIISSMLNARQTEISKLNRENEKLAKIVHSDNKIIPAMQLAVKSAIAENNKEELNSLLNDLEKLAQKRQASIEFCERADQPIQRTGVASFDAVMEFMKNKAVAAGISFDFSNMCEVDFIPEEIISHSELNTLAAEMLDNAIIAASFSATKKIFITTCFINGFYELSVFDSGIPFQAQTLINFGKKRASTHKDTGGSGIGLITISNILKRNGASFIIDENTQNGYTKKISALFNGSKRYIIKTNRPEIKEKCSVVKDISFEG